jgi:cholesterol oxidase
MKRLSKPITALKPTYDVIVIGSGYGGSIAASRFSRAGLKVCLLEKGKEFQPGEYPDTLAEAEKEMQINADRREAKSNGLYDLHISENISVFKGCGLGGTSLVNANVSIKPEDRVLDDKRWPSAIHNDKQSLADAYDRTFEMLKPSPYPVNKNGYPELEKTKAMRLAAEKMNQPFRYLDINVNFEDKVNHVGVEQQKCNNCGDCVTGCNYSAKNTLIMNYLPDAVNHGADIFCNADVLYVEKVAGQWVVYFNVFHTSRDKFDAPPMFVKANTVIISGGALGSTELLLRSKNKGLKVSNQLGKRFTGNGDVLGFGYNCEDKINGIGLGKATNHFENNAVFNVGPCITSVIDMRHKDVLEEGMTLEEGSIPGALSNMINISLLSMSKTIGIDTDEGFSDWLKEKKAETESMVRGPYHGATNRTITYLVMTHDDGKGEINLKNNRLNIDWLNVGSQPIFKKVNDTMLKATEALGGTFIRNAVWNKFMKYGLVTVHPLGGCSMADSAEYGVTNDVGNVFSDVGGKHTHQGLYVLDGSIIPLPLGTNPLFTISAIAERACKIILERMGKSISYEFPVVKTQYIDNKPAVQFTETMRGYFSIHEKLDFELGCEKGKQEQSALMFTLTIQAEDIQNFMIDPEHKGYMAGTVIAPMLSDHALTISDGIFNLFVKDETNPLLKKMKYSMQMHSVDGKTYYFEGYKLVEDEKGFDLWKDTSVLFVTIYNGKDNTAPVLGKGVLKILLADFITQMGTIKALYTNNTLDSLNAIKLFSSFFGKNLLDTYFSKLF